MKKYFILLKEKTEKFYKKFDSGFQLSFYKDEKGDFSFKFKWGYEE